MISTVSALEAIEKTIEGATPGEWILGPFDMVWHADDIEHHNGKWREKVPEPRIIASASKGNLLPYEDRANAAYIAACNPVAISELLAFARQAEALQQEVDSLKQTRQHSREASAALHDAFMEERKRVEALQRENAELRAFAASFKLTCVESSFYKDCYLHINEPDSVSFRLGNGSQFSKFIAGLEARRARALLGGENAGN